VQPQTLPHPFWAEQHESVSAIFWRVLLRCGVLAGLACAFMLWGVGPAIIVGGTLLLASVYSALVARLFRPNCPVRRTIGLAVRIAASLMAALAVITIAGVPGTLLVALALVVTPSVRRAAGDLARRSWAATRSRAPRR
jgi:hypothetical protein